MTYANSWSDFFSSLVLWFGCGSQRKCWDSQANRQRRGLWQILAGFYPWVWKDIVTLETAGVSLRTSAPPAIKWAPWGEAQRAISANARLLTPRKNCSATSFPSRTTRKNRKPCWRISRKATCLICSLLFFRAPMLRVRFSFNPKHARPTFIADLPSPAASVLGRGSGANTTGF